MAARKRESKKKPAGTSRQQQAPPPQGGDDSSHPPPALSKEDLELARSALFAAVEDCLDQDDDNDDDNDGAAADGQQQQRRRRYSPRPFLRLFVSSNHHLSLKPGGDFNVREQRNLLFSALESLGKPQARRFFAGLGAIVRSVTDTQAHVPRSALQQDDEEEDYDAASAGGEIVPDARSTENLRFLHYAALAVRSYLDGQAEEAAAKQNRSTASSLSVIEEAFQVALALHDVLFDLDSSTCGPDAAEPQATILSLCERWWLLNGGRREHLILQSLPLLALAAIGGGASTNDTGSSGTNTSVKRLFGVRHALEVIDFGDESSDSLRSMLLRLASSPLCLRQSEGKRFLAYMLQVDEILSADVHRAIRVQLPDSKRVLLEAYADIYFRAWKEAATAEMRQTLETECLSDLVYSALHVVKPVTNRALMTVLEPFHAAKKSPDVASLLVRMYGPILWRSTTAANPIVRIQAARILAHVFPLCETTSTRLSTSSTAHPSNNNTTPTTEQAVRKACVALNNLLLDRDSRVRVAGSEAVAFVLADFWDVLPAPEIRTLLNHIVAEHASDATSSAVRASAVNTITALLEAPQAHAVLRPLLPSIGNLIHDKVEKVRLAVVRMLIRVKKTKGIKYYHVVPVHHLTARLADEGQHNVKGPVASSLTALIANSCFPQGPRVTAAIQMERTITFLSNDPIAASVFYANIADHMPVDAVAKLAALSLRCVHSAVEKEQQKRDSRRGGNNNSKMGRKKRRRVQEESDDDDEEEDEENENEEEDSSELVSASDTAIVANLTEMICTLWQSIEDKLKLPENEDSHRDLVDSFSGSALMDVLAFFERQAEDSRTNGGGSRGNDEESNREDCHRTCAAILRLAGRLPAEAVEGLVPHVSALLGSLPAVDSSSGETSSTPNVTAHVALLCLWDHTEEVATSLATSIESVFEADHSLHIGSPDATSGKRRVRQSRGGSKSKNEKLVVPELSPPAALNILGDILLGSDPSSVAARQSILGSPTACSKIEKALERGTKYAERILVPGISSVYSRDFLESEVTYILSVCEAYGRFALHKEALSNGGIAFSDQARRLLDWTTGVVLPALLLSDSEKVPFTDSNLSRISMERSVDFPVSPVPTGPPKRRSKREKTPVRIHNQRSSFESPSDTTLSQESSESSPFFSVLATSFAVSIMQSCVVLFAEWLAVGGSGAEEIAASATAWTKIFLPNSNSSTEEGIDTGENENFKELLPAFSRLALQLCKTADNYSLLTNLLRGVQEDSEEGVEIGSSIELVLSALLSTRGNGNTAINKTVRCVLDAAHELLASSEFSVSAAPPISIGSICPEDCGCIVEALTLIVSNKQGCIELARILVDSFENPASLSANIAMFNTQCLSLIRNSSVSTVAPDVSFLVRRVDVAAFDPESAVVPVLRELVGDAA